MSQTLSSAIAWWARMQPDTVALCVDGASITYREYHDWGDRIAVRLMAEGVRPGDRVAVSGANSLEYCVLALGTLRAGAIFCPINMRFTRHEVTEALEDTTPRLLFCDAERRAKLEGVEAPLIDLAGLAQLRHGSAARPDIDLNPDWPIVIISTSGSTARPKGVVFSHRSMVGYVTEFALEEPGISQGAKAFGFAPLSTSAGFVQLMHYTTLGCSFYLDSAFDPAKALRMITDEKISAFGGVPLLFERIAALPEFAAADLSSLKIATVGGARVSRALLDAWNAKGVVLRQIYGQTEAGGNATIMPRHLALKAPEKCGWGGIFTDLVIRRPDGSPCAPGEVGEILIRGPGCMVGYWNNPQATAEAIRDGWLHSGDLGVVDESGLLTFVDRMKDIIISGGLNISAAEVERAVSEFPGVEEVLVIAAPDPKFAETPMAVVYAPQGLDVQALIRHCNDRLADYKVPRYVVVETEPLPRLATGKLSKPAVREKYRERSAELPRVR
jgi:fatty-acyl-CoA synthase